MDQRNHNQILNNAAVYLTPNWKDFFKLKVGISDFDIRFLIQSTLYPFIKNITKSAKINNIAKLINGSCTLPALEKKLRANSSE